MRQRTAGYKAPENLDELITHQQKMQDKIAEDMLILAQNLRGQSEVANKIIKKDTEVINFCVSGVGLTAKFIALRF